MSHSYLKQETEAKILEEKRRFLTFAIAQMEQRLADTMFRKTADNLRNEIKQLNTQLKKLG